jgi:hypothetical protein
MGIRTRLRFWWKRASRKVVRPNVGSMPSLDGGGFYPNKEVTITESGPGPLISIRRRTSEDWFPRGPGHGTLLSIISAPEGDLGADRPQGQRTRTQLANACGQLPAVSVQRAEQLVSLAKGSSPRSCISQLFHRANSPDVYRTFYAQLAHRMRKESSWETRRNVPKRAKFCQKSIESDFGPDFIGTLVPNFGSG